MIVKLIMVQYKGHPLGQYMPNVVDAWDEFVIDSNTDGWVEALQKAKDNPEHEEVRVLTVELPDDVVINTFDPPSIRLGVIK